MIKIIFTDMDGTFLDSSGEFNRSRFSEVFRKMNEEDVVFVPCSGKQCERIEELFGSYAASLYIVGDSAARIKHKGEYIYEKLLDASLAKEIIEDFCVKYDALIICCSLDATFVKEAISEEDLSTLKKSYSLVRKIKDFSELKGNLVKVSIYDKKKRCFSMVKDLEKYEKRAHVVASDAKWIDITNTDAHKGAVEKWLMKRLNFHREEAVAFTDSYNDMDLLDEARYGFCVSNAAEEVKEKSFFITKSNDEEGVLSAIDFILELQGERHE